MFPVNNYFDGNVVSIGFQTDTLPATVGVMAPGEFEFCPNEREVMTVVSGALTVKLFGADDWQTFNAGDSFEALPSHTFQLKVTVDTAYLCTYG